MRDRAKRSERGATGGLHHQGAAASRWRALTMGAVTVAGTLALAGTGLVAPATAAGAAVTYTETHGGPFETSSVGQTTIPIQPAHVGDLVVLFVELHATTPTVSSVSARNVQWQPSPIAIADYTAITGTPIQVDTLYGTATSTTSAVTSVAFTGTVARYQVELTADTFHATPTRPWHVAAKGSATGYGATVHTPALAAGTAAGIYVSYLWVEHNFVPGSTPGFTYHETTRANAEIYDTTVAPQTTYQATASQTSTGAASSGGYTSTAVIFSATPSSTVPPAPAVSSVSPASGPAAGGTTVAVAGSNFATGDSVYFGTTPATGVVVTSSTSLTATAPAGSGTVDVTVTGAGGRSAVSPADRFTYVGEAGYYLVGSDGGLFAFGGAGFFGSMGGHPLNRPVVGLAVAPQDAGYLEVAADGGIFAFGTAAFHGSMGGKPLNEPIVGAAYDTRTGGYYEVAADGGIFAFTAPFYGSMGGKPLNAPIVGMASLPTGNGYFEVASDGGIFAFGAAAFHGSMGGKPLNEPIVGMALDPTTGGYWEVASDGGIFAFTAPFGGSMGGKLLDAPVVGMAAS